MAMEIPMADPEMAPQRSDHAGAAGGSPVQYKSAEEDSSIPRDGEQTQTEPSHPPLDNPAHPSISSHDSPVVLPEEDQEEMFRALRSVFEHASEDDGVFNLRALLTALDTADSDARRGRQNIEILQEVRHMVDRLWSCKSKYTAKATQLLADGTRDPRWRAAFGQSGILEFYLRIVGDPGAGDDILLHALRLIGNCCADTDVNRQRVIEGGYATSIIKLFGNPAVVHVSIPVIYNICADYEPAHARVAADGMLYALLQLLADGRIGGNALLNYTYELVELTSEQTGAVDVSPDDSLKLVLDLLDEGDLEYAHFASLVNCLLAFLQHDRFQRISISDELVADIMAILERSYHPRFQGSPDSDISLPQLQLKINQTLSDISALPTFPQTYPLMGKVTSTLVSWLRDRSEDQLRICACVMLGNAAREDRLCESMIQDLEVHLPLISLLSGDAKGSVLHAALGFLKNLAIPSRTRDSLGSAGLIQAVSRLWAFDTVPQVQFMAVSLTRQVISASIANIRQLLQSLSSDPDSPANSRTYLSLLLSLFPKTDSSPIRMEIGRTIAAICRSLIRLDQSAMMGEAEVLVDRFFNLHEDVARPIGAIIAQTEWPVLQSEGWFALALMAWSPPGSLAAVDCVENMSVTQILDDLIRTPIFEPYGDESGQDTPGQSKRQKDRDNAIILVSGLLKNNPSTLTPTRRDMLEDLMRDAGVGVVS